MNHSIRDGTHNKDGKWKREYVLLELNIAIEGNKHLTIASSPLHQLPVQHAAPTYADYRSDVVTWQLQSKINGDIFVKENVHRRPGTRMRGPKRQLLALAPPRD